MMMREDVFSYVYALFADSRNGELTLGVDDEQAVYCVEWDLKEAEHLAQVCSHLLSQFSRLVGQYDRLLTDTRHLTLEQLHVWNTYLCPFPDHGMDEQALRLLWEKETVGEPLTEDEQLLSQRYDDWYAQIAMTRLPALRCAPTAVINRAQRYGRLIRLQAPQAVLDNEARCFIEEMLLYHHLK